MKKILNDAIRRAIDTFHGHTHDYYPVSLLDGYDDHYHTNETSYLSFFLTKGETCLKQIYEYLFVIPMAKLY